jgi:hypothetical protein
MAPWSALVFRGLLAVTFGTALTARMSMTTLTVVFAAYAVLDAILTFGVALRARQAKLTRWPLFLEAVFGILAGEIALAIAVGAAGSSPSFTRPRTVAFALIIVMAVRAAAMGVTQLIEAALVLRRPDTAGGVPSIRSRFMSFAGLASIGLGVALFGGAGRASMAVLVSAVAIYQVTVGLLLIVAGFAVKKHTLPLARAGR